MQSIQTKKRTNRNASGVVTFAAAAAVSAMLAACLTGCGLGAGSAPAPVSPVSPTGNFQLTGKVYGGSLPIGGATVTLYAANLNGYGNASTQVAQTTTSSTTGSTYGTFSLSGSASSCAAGAQVYVVSTGGNTGAGANSNTVLMAALGSCSAAPTAYPHFVVNESSTVAAVWALAPFMSDFQHVATSSTNVTGLAEAFANAAQLTNIVTGNSPGINLPSGTSVSQSALYTLADILAACVNTNGVGGSSSNCSTLFTNANVGTTPTDTVKAALIMAQNPALTATKISNLYALASASSPYQPMLSAAPGDLTLSITYAPSTLNAPSALAIDSSGQVWMTNSSSTTVTVISNAGTVNSNITGSSSVLSGPSAIAIDASGNAWIANKGNSTVSEVLAGSGSNGTNSPFSGGGISAPVGVAIDNQGAVWIANSGNTTITEISGSTVTGYTSADPYGAIAVAINPH